MTYDLILRGAPVIDPSQQLDAVTDVAFHNGKVARIGAGLKPDAGTEVRDVSGRIVTPGLIDLHTHVYWGGTSLGIDAEEFCRTSGVTTAIDTGSAGPGQLRRLPPPCDRAQRGAHPRLSARLVRRHLRVLAARDGGRERGDPAAGAGRCGRGRERQSRRRGRHQGAGGRACLGPLGHRAARRRAAGRRRGRPAADGAYRPSAADLRGGDRAAAAGRRPHPRVPPVPQRAGHRPGHGQAGGARGARARRAVRHRSRQGLVRVQDRARDAGQRLRCPTRSRPTCTRCASTARRSTRSRRCRNSSASACRSTT